ncbi:MAG: hypothetical protein Q8K68_13740, partial [Nitrospirota bacterium]|nr:hypothetical protein [Nitrospirota bacterium]
MLANRPVSGTYTGDPYVATDTKETYSWDGGIWVKVGNGTGGSGDMLKSTYDPNADGIIALAQLDTGVEKTANKGVANGYAG